MKCSCGAEIRAGAKFCGQCGKRLEVPYANRPHCKYCGNELMPNAKFCGKCGRSTVQDAPSGPKSGVTGKAQEWLNSRIVNKEKAKRLLIIVLVVGMCLVFSGIAGKIMMDGIVSTLQNTNMFAGASGELSAILNRSTGNILTKLIVSIIKNDSSGFVNVVRKAIGTVGSMGGDPYGITGLMDLFVGPLAQEGFNEIRSMLIKEAGILWPLLQIMAYYNEMLVLGIIIALVAAILLYLLDGQITDIRSLKIQSVVFVGIGWCVLIIVAAIIARFAL